MSRPFFRRDEGPQSQVFASVGIFDLFESLSILLALFTGAQV